MLTGRPQDGHTETSGSATGPPPRPTRVLRCVLREESVSVRVVSFRNNPDFALSYDNSFVLRYVWYYLHTVLFALIWSENWVRIAGLRGTAVAFPRKFHYGRKLLMRALRPGETEEDGKRKSARVAFIAAPSETNRPIVKYAVRSVNPLRVFRLLPPYRIETHSGGARLYRPWTEKSSLSIDQVDYYSRLVRPRAVESLPSAAAAAAPKFLHEIGWRFFRGGQYFPLKSTTPLSHLNQKKKIYIYRKHFPRYEHIINR